MQVVDLTGKQYGNLLVIKRADFNIGKRIAWECICSCGNKTIVPANNLTSGNTKTCGCGKYIGLKDNTSHGLCGTKLHDMYRNIRIRCFKVHPQHKTYTAKGITLCDEWSKFETFRDWAFSAGYVEGLQIDRIDNDGNYTPENCRFVNRVANCLNRGCRNKFGVIGLDYTERDGYVLKISLKSKRKYVVGFFKDIESARVIREQLVNSFIEKHGRLPDNEVTEELCKKFMEDFKQTI